MNKMKHDYELGVMVVLPARDQNIVKDIQGMSTNIKGVLVRDFWSNIEPAQGQELDFSYLDLGVGTCARTNRFAMLSVNCGNKSPAWLPRQWEDRQPYPWDPNALSAVLKLIASLGARYDSNPAILGVTVWVGGKTMECFFADPETEHKFIALGGPDVWLASAQTMLSAWRQAFPTTQLFLATGAVCPDGGVTMTTLAKQALSLGIGLQSNALSQAFPAPPHFAHTAIPLSKVPTLGYQLVRPVSNMGGATLRAVLVNGVYNNAQWVQIYPGDETGDPAQDAIKAFNDGTLK